MHGWIAGLQHWTEYLGFFVSLLAMLNPIGVVPLYMIYTKGETQAELHVTARVAALTASLVLLTALFVGDLILSTFGVSIPAFRIGGGLLILVNALSNLQGQSSASRQTVEEVAEGASKPSAAVVPLGIPLLAGTGSISAVILYAANNPGNFLHYGVLCTGIIICGLICWIVLRGAAWLSKALGRTGVNVFTRIMGLLMVSVGVQFIAIGLKALFPGLS